MKKILLVEDELFTRQMYVTKLKDEGFEIYEAITTDEAEEVLGKEKIDLIILDILLPKESGLDYLERLRKKNRSIPPVVILSNLEGIEYRKRVEELKAEAYFLKTNYTPSQIVELIKKYL